MSDSDSQFAPTWAGVKGQEQQPGMTITGKIVAARTLKLQQGTKQEKECVAIDVQQADGTVLSIPGWHHTLNAVLNELGEEGALHYGAEVTVEYNGTKSLDGGRSLKLYKVNGRESSGGGGAPSWFGGAPTNANGTVAPSVDGSLSAQPVAQSQGQLATADEPAPW